MSFHSPVHQEGCGTLNRPLPWCRSRLQAFDDNFPKLPSVGGWCQQTPLRIKMFLHPTLEGESNAKLDPLMKIFQVIFSGGSMACDAKFEWDQTPFPM